MVLTATDDFSEVDFTAYRLDEGSKEYYVAPFTIAEEGEHLLEYYSSDMLPNREPIRSVHFRIDVTPPTTTHHLDGLEGLGGWYITPVTVTLVATDPLSSQGQPLSGVDLTLYRLNGGEWLTYTAPFALADGHHTVTYRATDRAGNTGMIRTFPLDVDTTPPTTTCDLSGTMGGGSWYITPVTVTLIATDDLSGVSQTWYRLDGAPAWSIYAAPFRVSDEGTHTLEYRSLDQVLNLEPVRRTDFRLDLSPPTTAHRLAGALGRNGWYTTLVTVTLAATDTHSGVETTLFRLDGNEWLTYTTPWAVYTGGVHTVTYRSSDVAGHTEEPLTATLKLDLAPPTTTHQVEGVQGPGGWYTRPVTVTLSAVDDHAGVARTWYRLNQGDWLTYTVPFTAAAQNNPHLVYRSRDWAGNLESEREVVIGLDLHPPTTTHRLQGMMGREGWYTWPVTVMLVACDDLAGVEETRYRLDGGTWMTYTQPFSVSAEGEHLLEYHSTDRAGNVEEGRTATFRLDLIPPTTTHALEGLEGLDGWYITPVTITLVATDTQAGVETTAYRLDGGEWMTYTAPLLVADGRHTVRYRSTDRAGNTEAGHSIPFGVDTTPPTSTALLSGTMGGGGWYITAVTVTLVATDDLSGVVLTQYRLDGASTWSDYAAPFVVSNEGLTTVHFRSIDQVWNVEEAKVVTVTLDLGPPTTTHRAEGGVGWNGWYTTPVTVTLVSSDTLSGVALTTYRLDGGGWLS